MKKVTAILLAVFMLLAYIPQISAEGTPTILRVTHNGGELNKDAEIRMSKSGGELELEVYTENMDNLTFRVRKFGQYDPDFDKELNGRVENKGDYFLFKAQVPANMTNGNIDYTIQFKTVKWANAFNLKVLVSAEEPTPELPDTPDEPAVEYVNIPDKLFLKVINKNLDENREDDQKVTKTEMESLTTISHYLDDNGKPGIIEEAKKSILGTPKSLQGTDDAKFMVSYGIKSIEGIQYAKNLKQLKLNENEVVDISPLRDLTQLEYLEFSRNRVVDIEPIRNLKNLTFLKLYNNWIEDVSPIADLTNLTGLDIHYNVRVKMSDGKKIISNGITDISPLKNLTKLQYFDVSGNRIKDASVILNFPDIKHLDLSSNNIETYVGLGEKIAKLNVIIGNETPGFSQNFWAQEVSIDEPIVVKDNSVEFENKYKGFKELFTAMVKEFNSEDELSDEDLLQAVQENTSISTKKSGVEPSYDLANNKIKLTLSDDFIEKNRGKEVKIPLTIIFAETYSWNIDVNLNVEGKKTEPKEPIQALLTKNNVPVMDTLNFEVFEGDNSIEKITSVNGMLNFTKYEAGKTYTLKLTSDKYDLITGYVKVVNEQGMYGLHFLEKSDEPLSINNAGTIKLKDKADEPEQPIGDEVLKELPVRVKIDGKLKEGIIIGIHLWDFGIPNLIHKYETDGEGKYILKDLQANTKYTIRIITRGYKFKEEEFNIITNKDGHVKSINNKSVKDFADGIVFDGTEKNNEQTEKVTVKFNTVYKENNEAAKGVVLTANIISPNLSSYRDETSNEKGEVTFEIEGTESGKIYAITVSKNAQFLWKFEPELVEVVVYKDRYEIIPTKDNMSAENIIRVTKDDRTHLKADLSKLIKEAEELIASQKYTEKSIFALKTAVKGGKMELEEGETIPYYVEGHIKNIRNAIKKLVMKEVTIVTEPKTDAYSEYTDLRDNNNDKKNEAEKPKVEKEPELEILIIDAPEIPFGMIDVPLTPTQDAIKNMVTRGILKGTGGNKFEPKMKVSRAMVTEVLMRLSADKTIDDSIKFSDVKNENWFSKSVKWAATHEVIKGYGDGTFRADRKITLQEFAYMLKRYAVNMPKTVNVDKGKYPFLPAWSRDAVLGLVETGLIDDSELNKDNFNSEINREYLAVVIDRLIKFTEAGSKNK